MNFLKQKGGEENSFIKRLSNGFVIDKECLTFLSSLDNYKIEDGIEYVGDCAINIEVNTENHHENCNYPLQIRTVARNTVRLDTKTSRTCGTECMHCTVKYGHSTAE